ncbi:MAG: cupredoxin domain-containing protein [Jatrophihabitantaceae bacterium]
MPVSRRLSAAAVALLATCAIAGCSNRNSSANRQPHHGSGTASVVNGVQQITLHASDFRFDPSTVTVHPGKVRVILVNDGGGAPHNFRMTDFPADFVPLTANGQSSQATFTAPSPGTYQFVCTIHTAQGMTGKLVVLPS